METFINSLKTAFFENVGGNLSTWGLKLLGGIAAFIVGLWIIRFIMNLVGKAFDKKHVDPTLKPFLITLIGFVLKAALFIAVASTVGIEVTSFVALLGAAGLAVGMAFQGSLGNLASGVMLLVFRPFKVGDLIEADGKLGFVREISVFVTFIETFQNQTVIIPNGVLASGTVTNFSAKGNVRADIPFAIRYDADQDKAMEIALNVLKSSDKVLKDPAPSVYITNLGESAVELMALPYTTVNDYWDVFWGLRGEIKKQLGAAGFEAPLPQRIITQK
ncbi:MAG: mechanosensitive ion channel [Chitinophagales bacterium]|nr:mechanosensitive ion channel [Chitinophagales bacterium]